MKLIILLILISSFSKEGNTKQFGLQSSGFSDNTNFGHLEIPNVQEDEHVRKGINFPVSFNSKFRNINSLQFPIKCIMSTEQ